MIIRILCAVSFLFVFCACEGPKGDPGVPGEPGKGTNWDVYDFKVQDNHWNLSTIRVDEPGSNYYYSTRDEKLTEFIAYDGFVFVYMYDGVNKEGKEVQVPLPYTQHNIDDKGNTYTTTYDFEIAEGVITFYVTNSNYKTSITPGTREYRVLYMW